jgi:hypothetical protein
MMDSGPVLRFADRGAAVGAGERCVRLVFPNASPRAELYAHPFLLRTASRVMADAIDAGEDGGACCARSVAGARRETTAPIGVLCELMLVRV